MKCPLQKTRWSFVTRTLKRSGMGTDVRLSVVSCQRTAPSILRRLRKQVDLSLSRQEQTVIRWPYGVVKATAERLRSVIKYHGLSHSCGSTPLAADDDVWPDRVLLTVAH